MSQQSVTPAQVSLPRSQPPAIPTSFLSRKHLFPLFESNVPGATLVIAPAGYGKTTLVSEWAQASARPTFWYTADTADTIQDFQAHVVVAVEKYFPNFFQGVENIEHYSPEAAIKFLGKAIGQLSGEFNFVIDAGRAENKMIAPYAELITESIPENAHLVVIRRTTPLTSLSRFATAGNLSLITSEELKFSPQEVAMIANINGVDLSSKKNSHELDMCEGWPSAVQMMCRNIQKGNSHTTFADAVASNVNPLSLLALESYNMLSQASREKLHKLSVIEEFDTEIAQIILGKDYSEAFINRLATDGFFVTVSTTANRTYRFNPIMFEALSQLPHESVECIRGIQSELAELFIARNDLSKALHFAHLAGNQQRFTEIFRSSVRQVAAIGRGDVLIKWATFAGDNSAYGEVMKKAVKVVGHLVSSEFKSAEALAMELEYMGGLSPEGEFLTRLSASVKANIYFARGDFERTTQALDVALLPLGVGNSFDSTDFIALHRVKARQAFLYDDFDVLAQACADAKAIPVTSDEALIAYQLSCIQSMLLYAEGKYIQAAELAGIAISQATANGYVGINGPKDALMVLARAQLEASQIQACVETLNYLMRQAKEWEIWPWYFMAEGTLIRIQISQGAISVASDAIAKQRAFLSTLQTPHQLNWIVDMSEIYLRLATKDWQRADEVIQRMPEIELVRQIKLNIINKQDPKKTPALVAALPENTVRQQINKFLTEANMNIDQENTALKSLNKALEIGAENGYFEYFIRQTALYPLMVKAAAAKPTIYLEELVNAMTKRIHEINNDSGEIAEKLTQRELEILKHLTTGNPISSIAKSLHISQNTIKTHLRNTYRKLDADGRYTAVEKAKKLLLI